MSRPRGSRNKQPGMTSAQRQRRYRARQYLKQQLELKQLLDLIKNTGEAP